MIRKAEEELQKELQIKLSVMTPIWTSNLTSVQTLYQERIFVSPAEYDSRLLLTNKIA